MCTLKKPKNFQATAKRNNWLTINETKQYRAHVTSLTPLNNNTNNMRQGQSCKHISVGKQL